MPALSLLLPRSAALLRLASPSVRRSAANGTRRALAVRAFKEQEGAKSPASPAPSPPSETQVQPAAPPTPLEVLPFRRMSDAMVQMQREMDALFESFAPFDDPFFGPAVGARRSRSGPLSPFSLLDSLMPSAPAPSSMARAVGPLSRMVPVEVSEDETSLTVTAEVPGFAKEDIRVTVDPARNLLTISGEKTTTTGAGSGEAAAAQQEGAAAAPPVPSSRSSMTFTRSFTLPPDVDLEQDIKATAEHGVLKVVLPKAAHKEPPSTVRAIPIA